MENLNTDVTQNRVVDLKEINVNNSMFYLFNKRSIDLIGSCIGLILLTPLFLVLAILIKVEEPKAQVFFKQTRIGKNEKEFEMYKFRSMVSNAEDMLDELLDKNEVSGAMFKIKNDPRVTKLGRFIRRTSIDELPQLINVIKGEMTLVGPRPPLIREVNDYSEYQKQRLIIKPGCTGIWQVSARNNVGFEEMVEMDLKYAVERSIKYDLKIIFLTFAVILSSKAY